MTVTQSNCTTIIGTFKLDGKVVDTKVIDITSIIGLRGGMVLYTYQPSLTGVTGSFSIGNVTVNQAAFWFNEVRGGISTPRTPETVPRNCDSFCPNDCNDRGTCVNGLCECKKDYIGYSCNIYVDSNNNNCFSDILEPNNTLCVDGPERVSDCHSLLFNVMLGDKRLEWIVDVQNPLTEARTNQLSLEHNECLIDLDIFYLSIDGEGAIRGTITATLSCVGSQAYPIHSFSYTLPPNCLDDAFCSFSTMDDRVIPEPTNVLLNPDRDVFYTMQQFSENPIIDLSFNVKVSRGVIEASYNPLCRPNDENARGTQEFTPSSSNNEWVIIPRDECTSRVFDPKHAMFYYFRFKCVSQEECQFSLDVKYHNLDELQIRSKPVAGTPKPIFIEPFYQYYQVVVSKENFRLKLDLNYNDRSSVYAEIYAISSKCASKSQYSLSTSQRVNSTRTDQGRVLDEYVLDVVLDSELDIVPGKYLEITVNFTAVNGAFPVGYYALSAFYLPDVPSLPPVVDPETTPDDPQTPVDPPLPPETPSEGGETNSNPPGDDDDDDDDDDSDGDGESSSNNVGLYIGLSVGALLLIAIVVVAAAGVGFVLYRRSKKSRYPLSIDDDGLLLSDEGGVDFDL